MSLGKCESLSLISCRACRFILWSVYINALLASLNARSLVYQDHINSCTTNHDELTRPMSFNINMSGSMTSRLWTKISDIYTCGHRFPPHWLVEFIYSSGHGWRTTISLIDWFHYFFNSVDCHLFVNKTLNFKLQAWVFFYDLFVGIAGTHICPNMRGRDRENSRTTVWWRINAES